MHSRARALYKHDDLARLIDPKVVAIVGASETQGSFGQRTLANMRSFQGKVFAINPKYRTLLDRPCLPSLSDLPESPDCVVLCVARPMVQSMIEAAGAVGTGGAIVYASGFSETGEPDRVAEQDELIRTARSLKLAVAGPNCVGLANTRTKAGMHFMPDYDAMGHKRGPMAIVSQSGALGYALLQGMARGIGFSHYLAAGNSADVDVADFISYLAENEDVRSIIACIEGVKDGAHFLEAARRARAAGKALIVYKAGNSEISAQAARSHTGSLVGSLAAYRAALDETGAVMVENLEQVIEMASFFAHSGKPAQGRGVGILSTSGGAAVICADKAEQHGIVLPPLTDATAEKLRSVVPDFGSVANPADLTAEVLKSAETFSYCLNAFLNDSSYSGYVVPMVFAHPASSVARAPMVVEAARNIDKPIAVVWMNEWLEGPGTEIFDADPMVANFRSADRCLATFRAWFDWHAWQAPVRGTRRSPASAADVARRIIADEQGPALSETTSKRILAEYGVAIPQEVTARNAEQAVAAAKCIGFPVVLKVASPDIMHKTEADGVRLNLTSADNVRQAAQEIFAAARSYAPTARIEGVCVQKMLPRGIETIVGVKNDMQFGPLVAVGLGGILVELLNDTAVRLAPISPVDARAMLNALKAAKLLEGYRGQAGIDRDALADTICRLSELAYDLRDIIKEIDVNPIIATPDGATAADALIVLKCSSDAIM
ncbi:acetate--CoA ligase family protein [Pseudorhodoplanes sp.]|uniref:acetate--CoA ligase family protein n=1 Tax=Pseudorhodoplanes sp. TaxID=1934341 RepID=UPI003D123DC6